MKFILTSASLNKLNAWQLTHHSCMERSCHLQIFELHPSRSFSTSPHWSNDHFVFHHHSRSDFVPTLSSEGLPVQYRGIQSLARYLFLDCKTLQRPKIILSAPGHKNAFVLVKNPTWHPWLDRFSIILDERPVPDASTMFDSLS